MARKPFTASPMGFSERLSDEIRKQPDISGFCQRNNIARSSLYGAMFDRRDIGVVFLAKLCASLGVSADYLLFGK